MDDDGDEDDVIGVSTGQACSMSSRARTRCSRRAPRCHSARAFSAAGANARVCHSHDHHDDDDVDDDAFGDEDEADVLTDEDVEDDGEDDDDGVEEDEEEEDEDRRARN